MPFYSVAAGVMLSTVGAVVCSCIKIGSLLSGMVPRGTCKSSKPEGKECIFSGQFPDSALRYLQDMIAR